MLSSRVSRVSSGFGEKTRQLTSRFQVLEVEIRRRPSLVSSQSIIGPNQMGLGGWVGSRFCWTPLNITPISLEPVDLKLLHEDQQ